MKAYEKLYRKMALKVEKAMEDKVLLWPCLVMNSCLHNKISPSRLSSVGLFKCEGPHIESEVIKLFNVLTRLLPFKVKRWNNWGHWMKLFCFVITDCCFTINYLRSQQSKWIFVMSRQQELFKLHSSRLEVEKENKSLLQPLSRSL